MKEIYKNAVAKDAVKLKMIMVCIAFFISSQSFSQWVTITDGSTIPNPEEGLFTVNGLPEEISTVYSEGDENYLLMEEISGVSFTGQWIYSIADFISDPEIFAMTVVFRVKGSEGALFHESQGADVMRYLDFRIESGKYAENIRGSIDGFNLERMAVTMPDYDFYNWHIIRVTVDNAASVYSVYLDEDSEPYITGTMTRASTATRIYFGDSGGTRMLGTLLDYVIFDPTGAYAPGEGTAIPSEYYTSAKQIANANSRIFPNPVTSILNIEVPEGYYNSEIVIYNIMGNVVMSQYLNGNNSMVNVEKLSKGSYFVKVIAKDKTPLVQRIVKQ